MDRNIVLAMQQAVCETARDMAASGLTAGTWGNVSGRVDNTYMVITPSGMDYGRLTPEQMVLVNMLTGEYEGPLKPSVEVPLHAKLLLTRPEVGASSTPTPPRRWPWPPPAGTSPPSATTRCRF